MSVIHYIVNAAACGFPFGCVEGVQQEIKTISIRVGVCVNII